MMCQFSKKIHFSEHQSILVFYSYRKFALHGLEPNLETAKRALKMYRS